MVVPRACSARASASVARTMPWPASTRVAAVQSCPALKYPATAMPSAAGGDVGVVEHDDRGLAAQLEVHPLEVVGGGHGHLPAGPDASR